MNLRKMSEMFGVLIPEELDSTLDMQNGNAICCKFNRWGTLIAVGGTDGRVYIFDFVTKGMVKNLLAHVAPVTSLSWSRDGRKLLSASSDTTIIIWDVLSGTVAHKLKYPTIITYAAFNPRDDNKVIVLQINMPPTVDTIQPPSKRTLIHDIPGSADDVISCVTYDRKAKYILCGTAKGKVVVFDADTYKCLNWGRQNSVQQIRQIVCASKGGLCLTSSQDRIIRTYNVEDLVNCVRGNIIESKLKLQDLVNKIYWKSACTDADGYFICAASCKNNLMYIWESSSGSLMKILEFPKGEVLHEVQWHPTRCVILSVAQSAVSIWAQAHVENWSAFAPEFRELEENMKYEEKEGEFDMEDEDTEDTDKQNDPKNSDELIDVVTVGKDSVLASSDEILRIKNDVSERFTKLYKPGEQKLSFFAPKSHEDLDIAADVTLKTGPLWYLPIAPEMDIPDAMTLIENIKTEMEEEIKPNIKGTSKGRKLK